MMKIYRNVEFTRDHTRELREKKIANKYIRLFLDDGDELLVSASGNDDIICFSDGHEKYVIAWNKWNKTIYAERFKNCELVKDLFLDATEIRKAFGRAIKAFDFWDNWLDIIELMGD